MQSEMDIIDSLNALGYEGECLQEETLTKAVTVGLNSKILRDLICWLAAELHVLRKTDEQMSADILDIQEFAMELSSFIKELGCVFNQLITGPLEERFSGKQQCFLLLELLISELMFTKMHLRLQPQQQNLIIAKTKTNTAQALERLAKNLNIGEVPQNVSTKALFDKLNFKVEEKLRQIKPGVLSAPLYQCKKPLSEAQWQKLEELCNDLEKEYNLRRQMLLTRLEVTVKSFNWSERLQSQQHKITDSFEQQMQELDSLRQGGADTNIIALLAARQDLAIIEKTSSVNVRKNTGCKIQKHVIGHVPDRGGRANEHAPPPPEMPAWQKQRASGGGRGGGRGGYGNRGGHNNYQAQPQRQQYQGKPQYQNYNRNNANQQEFISGTGRVQGSGWTQGGHQERNNDDYRRGSDGYHRGGYNNYNRGGRR